MSSCLACHGAQRVPAQEDDNDGDEEESEGEEEEEEDSGGEEGGERKVAPSRNQEPSAAARCVRVRGVTRL